ncbi:glycoside hydrolase family 10 protein [Chamaesiphon sp. VAR_48_metabat_135_sub]|uniref:glycoside hydrolase family 10 protein n=1 Tax=Chamaesiphon sp. VAR_48_metabat_135_sub TaxID=2964699 RepID=UPI00286CA80B|nr:glycoside hydrolase family 10 protein [Chamaesiphon sp. VAR_48_metabat_135_sub]
MLNRKFWFGLLIIIGLILSLTIPAVSFSQSLPNKPVREIRGVWITNVDSDVLFTRDRLATAIKDLRKLNFNTIYPVVWNWGYTTYPSKVAKKIVGSSFMPKKSAGLLINRTLSKAEGLEGRDVLQEMVIKGHKQKMAVIPWFEFGFMAPATTDPAGSDLAKLHPDWLTQKQDGGTIWKEGKDPRVWLNPFKPEVKKFIIDLVVEVVKKYDVDGIQFDDHFGLPAEFGYDKFTVDLYKSEHQGKLPPNDPKNEEWINWRADKITDLMHDLFTAIKTANPKSIVSISPNPQGFAKSFFLQDWAKWERQGLVEELLIQVYRDKLETFIGELKKPEVKLASQHIPVGIGILTGVKPKPIPMKQIQTQIAEVRKQGLAGVSFFFYETLWKLTKEPELARKDGFKQVFAKSVDRPSVIR